MNIQMSPVSTHSLSSEIHSQVDLIGYKVICDVISNRIFETVFGSLQF